MDGERLVLTLEEIPSESSFEPDLLPGDAVSAGEAVEPLGQNVVGKPGGSATVGLATEQEIARTEAQGRLPVLAV
jgi:hypothetical protein